MGYDASCEIRTVTGELLPEASELSLKTRMESCENLQDLFLANLDKGEMVTILKLNGIDPELLDITKNNIDMVCMITDGVIRGLPENCGVCKSRSLVECHGRICCWGSMLRDTTSTFSAYSTFKLIIAVCIQSDHGRTIPL